MLGTLTLSNPSFDMTPSALNTGLKTAISVELELKPGELS